ncbi:MAG: hypothetical protein MUC99_09000 [Anaerolineae bacterium]|nr:hypothetical protein [Anaerolineae bacterium]
MKRTLPALIPALLAVWLFSYTLDLPPFLDDGNLHTMIHDFQNVGTHGVRFWNGSASYQYYRPLGFTVMELAYQADGRWDVFGLHAFNLLIYAATAAGVGAIGQRLTGSPWGGVLAGCAFVLYPYTYRSVTWIAAIFHLMVAFGLVMTLVFGLMWLDGRRGGVALVLAWGAAFVALFSQEVGIVVAPLMVLAAWAVRGWGVWRNGRLWALVVPLALLTGGFLVRYGMVPRPAAGPLTLYLDQAPSSLAVFGQGFAFPFFALIRRAGDVVGTLAEPRTLPMLALLAGVVAGGVWVAGRARWRAAVMGVLAFVGLAAPALILTDTEYVKGSPHVMTTAAVGMGVFWGVVLWAGLRHPRRWVRAGVVGVMVVSVGVSLLFNAARRTEAIAQAEYHRALYALVSPDPEGVVMVNTPAFLGAYYDRRWFLTGSEATMFMLGYAGYHLTFRALDGRDYPPFTYYLYTPSFQRPPTYEFAPFWTDDNTDPAYVSGQVAQARRVVFTEIDGDRFTPILMDGADWPAFVAERGWP